jgi:hypothetical protein
MLLAGRYRVVRELGRRIPNQSATVQRELDAARREAAGSD